MFAAGKTSSSVFIQPTAQKEAVFTAVGTTNWTVPTGVTSISVVCIGGGGSGSESTSGGSGGVAGDLRYYNNLSVTPGETLAITVGAGGVAAAATGNAGGFSNIARGGVTLLEAAGGGGGTTSGSSAKNGTSSTIGGSIGGGDGGIAPDSGTAGAGGGGGAGGYAGNGGNGGSSSSTTGSNGATDSGAAGGGGGTATDTSSGAFGGGVNVFGIGLTGVGGTANDGATAGSYGDGALNNTETGNSSDVIIPTFGGGGGGSDSTSAGSGGQGCVRIIWPGNFVKFPSEDAWMSKIIPTVIETQSATSSITIPNSALSGDLAVLMNLSETVGAQSDPSGWTRIINQQASSPVMTVWYRILQSGDANTAVTMTSGSSQSAEMLVFRKAAGIISSVNVSNATIDYSIGVVTTQVKTASTSTAPLIVFGAFAVDVTTVASSDMYFTGGLAGTGNVEPSGSFSGGNGDTSRQGFMRFRIYDTAPSANVSVVCRRNIGTQTMGSFIIGVT